VCQASTALNEVSGYLTMRDLMKSFDRYDLMARVLPGALAPLVPALALGIGLPQLVTADMRGLASYAFLTLAASAIASHSARSAGRTLQERLKVKWGGLPTELLLSWSDPTIEAPTKRAYHKALQRLVPDIALPGPEEEQADRAAAMDGYRAAVRRLIEARRGPAHHFILNENIAFGFWRNVLGMRWIAILLASLSMVALVLGWRLGVTQPTMLAPSCGLLLIWVAFQMYFVTAARVRDSGVAYAERLFASLIKPAGATGGSRRATAKPSVP
jgi:hypothetical protein